MTGRVKPLVPKAAGQIISMVLGPDWKGPLDDDALAKLAAFSARVREAKATGEERADRSIAVASLDLPQSTIDELQRRYGQRKRRGAPAGPRKLAADIERVNALYRAIEQAKGNLAEAKQALDLCFHSMGDDITEDSKKRRLRRARKASQLPKLDILPF